MPGTPTPVALVRVEDRYNPSQVDMSDAVFTIAPAITIEVPNGGEVFAAGEVVNITWENNGATNYTNLDYSTNGGITWNSIAFNAFTPSSTYAWTVPALENDQYLVRVTDNIDGCKHDHSDATFEVGATAPANIVLTNPAGGEVWEACTTQTITWSHTGTSDQFDLHYSTDLGATWQVIVNNHISPEGSFAWYVPQANSSTTLIRVRDHLNANTNDTNNLPITLSAPVAYAGEDQVICPGEIVPMQATGGVLYSWTPGDYLSSTDVSNPFAAPGLTTTYTVTVTDENGCSDSDTVTLVVTENVCDIGGCTDENAVNFNPLATIDNGSCLYTNGGSGCPGDLSGDNTVDTNDILILLGSFGVTCSD